MTPIERQSLKNQYWLMKVIADTTHNEYREDLDFMIENTAKLLNPNSDKEDSCEIPEECICGFTKDTAMIKGNIHKKDCPYYPLMISRDEKDFAEESKSEGAKGR